MSILDFLTTSIDMAWEMLSDINIMGIPDLHFIAIIAISSMLISTFINKGRM